METIHLSVRDGEIDDAGSWLYVWALTGRAAVIYVGATSLPPALRAWLHLHHSEPSVARIADRFAGALAESFEVIACTIPGDLPRREAKAELISQLDRRHMLAEGYLGDPPDQLPRSEHIRRCIHAVVAHIEASFAH